MPWWDNKYIPDEYWHDFEPDRGYAGYQQVMERKRAEGPRRINYSTYIPHAFRRYMEQIYGPGGTKGYIKGQVQGASDVISPYLQAASSRGAAGLAARGGLAGGAQEALQSGLLRQKTNRLAQAASGAQRDVMQTGQNVLGMAQREGFQLTQDELNKLRLALEERRIRLSERELEELLKGPGFWDVLNNILQAGGSAAGAYFGSR